MNHPETQLQIQVVNYLRTAAPGLLFWHVPNGGRRDAREAAKLKAMGTMPGVPDLAFILPPNGRAAFIELKASKGKATPEQLDFQAAANNRGACYSLCNSLDQVEQTLRLWGVDLRGRIAA